MSSKRSNRPEPTGCSCGSIPVRPITAGSSREPCPRGGRRSHDCVVDHVFKARNGDPGAWSHLVRKFEGMLRALVGRYRLSGADASDVVQTTWLRLAENLDRLQDPSRVGAWLATTARHECLRTRRACAREIPDEQPPEPRDREPAAVDRGLLQADRNAELWSAFARLPARDQALLRMLLGTREPSYKEISTALAIPIGSIGPTRGRALERLRGELERGNRLHDLAA
jgi:RNA polymerase sigma factor (sigma-70 family)